jgi:hypothetical protein
MGRGERNRRAFLGAAGVGAAAALGPTTLARAADAHAAARASASTIIDVTAFGAARDGRTPATAALQKAIDTCAAAGGGMVLVPPGQYLTAPLFLRSNLHLHLTAGATLMASDRFDDYPPIDSRSEGIERKSYASLLTGIGLENVTITGRGVLDGQGPPWWRAHEITRNMRLERNLPREADNPAGAPLRWPRPRILNLVHCEGVVVSGLTVRDGPAWDFHLVYCQDVLIDGVTLQGLQAEHCDGIIIDSCRHVRIANCCLGSGSEGVALKSGYNEDGRRVGIACEDVTITNCHFLPTPGAAIGIGSETAGGIRNVTITGCTIGSCNNAVHVRSPRGRGGVVENIRISNLVVDQFHGPALLVSHFYDSLRMGSLFGEGPSPEGNPETDRKTRVPAGEGTPTFREIVFSDITLGPGPAVAVVEGLPERYITGVTFKDIDARRTKAGITGVRVTDLTVSGLAIEPSDAPAVAARDVEGLEVHRLECRRSPAGPPLVELENVSDAFVHGCRVARSGTGFVHLRGSANRNIELMANKTTVALPTRKA